eukprot:COSAG01_NODE_56240_length_319_cov_3.722727_1_plen_39_part_01
MRKRHPRVDNVRAPACMAELNRLLKGEGESTSRYSYRPV